MANDARAEAQACARAVRTFGVFEPARLRAYGYTVAITYGFLLIHFYWAGAWIVDRAGAPIYTEFTTIWVAGIAALHGITARLYDSAQFLQIQAALLGPRDFFYPNWPYPPTFSLIAAPFGALPYLYAFLVWDGATLVALIAVVYVVVRRAPAIAVALASPFTAWNFLAGQNGCLTGALIGAALYFLERRPVLAGVFLGGLTYKPQFGILFPVALVAARQWRAMASAAVTAAALAGVSAAAFGAGAWEMLPRALLVQTHVVLAGGQADPGAEWGRLQTIYGLVRDLRGGGVLAWSLQGATALGLALVVWHVWRLPARHALKAAIISAAALIATPYAFSYDLAALAIPIAFLANDQLQHGVLRGEQMTLLALFGLVVAALFAFGDTPDRVTFGSLPLGPVVVVALLALLLRRVLWSPDKSLAERLVVTPTGTAFAQRESLSSTRPGLVPVRNPLIRSVLSSIRPRSGGGERSFRVRR